MLIRRGFKFELKPNGMQIQLMKQFCGCARYVYNRTLSLDRSLYKKDNKLSSRSRKNLQNFKESLRDKRKEAETAERQSEKLLDCIAI